MRPLSEQLAARVRRWKHRYARHAKGLANAWRDSRTIAREQGLSRVKMLSEAALLAVQGRMAVDTYFHYRLFDPKLSAEAKREFLSEAPGANRQLWSVLTPRRYGCLFENKLIFNRYFTSVGLPLATVFGVFDPQVGRSMDGESLRTEPELRTFLRRFRQEGFAFKPAEGVRGHLVLILTGSAPGHPDTFLTLAGERYDAAGLVAATRNTAALENQEPGADLSSFLIEERFRPHADLAEFIGPTLCTVRVVTIVALDGSPQIVASVFKLQPKPLGVDHLMYGALGCWVDPDTGALGPGRTRTDYVYTSRIPGTDRSFVGYRLPCWTQVKEVALRAAVAFPWARSVGWDIGISDRGAVLIEGNQKWSPSLAQLPAPHGLMRDSFKALYDALREGNRR